jgi:hypothetical protein
MTDVHTLPGLLNAVEFARDRLADRRADARPTVEQNAARAELLDALERYAAALDAAHRPLPYRLRDELRLRRALGV